MAVVAEENEVDGGVSSLSPEQLSAIELLLTGATDQHVADSIGRHRVTVTRWRLYHPQFRSALYLRQRDAYRGAADAMRGILPMALDTLRDQLRVGQGRGAIAVSVLHKAGLITPTTLGATDVRPPADDDAILMEILDAEVRRRRAQIREEDAEDELGREVDGPVTAEEREAAMGYLLERAGT
jgi:hypothetical protein